MVLESILSPVRAEREPWEMFFIGLVYCSVAVFLSRIIFPVYASLVSVFLTTLASLPVMYLTLKVEEKKDIKYKSELRILKNHGRAISFFIYLFLGFVVSYTLWYTLLPQSSLQTNFGIQLEKYCQVNNIKDCPNRISSIATGSFGLESNVIKIFLNNFSVLAFSILFSFLYGSGAIFILSWNASVIGVATGNLIRTEIYKLAVSPNSVTLTNYFQIYIGGIFKYLFHGIFEIGAYFVGGLAGGILSFAIIKHHYTSRKFVKVLVDVADLLLISILLLLIAAFIEVYITPTIYYKDFSLIFLFAAVVVSLLFIARNLVIKNK